MSRPNGPDKTVHRRPYSNDAPLPPQEKLPDELQKMVDDEETLMDSLYDGTYVLSRLTCHCSIFSRKIDVRINPHAKLPLAHAKQQTPTSAMPPTQAVSVLS